MTTSYGQVNTPTRILLGPGPSNVHPRVLQASLAPMVGYLDTSFVQVMQETVEMLRPIFGTANEITFPLSGTGHSGMEAGFISLMEPGDKLIVGVNGFFGQRIAEVASRSRAEIITVEAEWGRIVEPEDVEAALRAHAPVKGVVVVMAETSTGVLQPLSEISRLAHQYGALFLVDGVTALGGTAVDFDANDVDYCYSCTQKCVGSVTGMSPVSLSKRGRQVMAQRKTKVGSWYLDLMEAWKYWSKSPAYHHTGPITMVYALHEALRLIHQEGLAARYLRHQVNGDALKAGLEAMGLELLAQPGHRTSMLTTVRIPEGVDDARVRQALLDGFNLEFGGGLGSLRGKIWRIGLMGYGSQEHNVLLALSALGRVLKSEGFQVEPGAGEAAASKVFAERAAAPSIA